MSSVDILEAATGAKYSFELESSSLECSKSNREIKEQLLQYNLDNTLEVLRFRLIGQIGGQAEENYLEVLRDFFSSSLVMSALETIGEPTMPILMQAHALGTDVMNMEFFDRFSEMGIIGPGGKIRGCFDETFDGIVVSVHLLSTCQIIYFIAYIDRLVIYSGNTYSMKILKTLVCIRKMKKMSLFSTFSASLQSVGLCASLKHQLIDI